MEKRYSFTKKELIEIYQTAKKGLWPDKLGVVVPRCDLDPDCKTLGANQIEFEVLPDESENS